MIKKYILPLLILLMSILYIFFIPSDPMEVKLLFKLIPMWLMIGYAFLQVSHSRTRTHYLILAGLFFCMLGDGLLIWFVVGLSAFLIGHLFYMAGFFSQWRFSIIRFLSIVPIGVYSFIMGSKLVNALEASGDDALILPVMAYITVISLMLWSAVMTRNPWAIVGSTLFVISDSILSWNMFISDVPYSGILIMTTYYSAQFLIARSLSGFQGSVRHSSTRRFPVN
ncbi:lysoplasmalogenase [Paenibacillus dakarensis]|uniref:lysoplasmalogenase n=1 Tax=Paenibacillus dakarensis TaxID=1527293 RepID=UPI0006D575FE|nr:lysoplasmalogenase [Paenibacillus dakarensis]